MSSTSNLFRPLIVGDIGKLEHRIVLAPLTRIRNNDADEPTELAVEYYSQRSRVLGTLLISEATAVSPNAVGIPGTPGIWTEGQASAWKKVTDAVHANGSFMVAQLWFIGAAANSSFLSSRGNYPYVSVSDFHWVPDHERPRPLTITEIGEIVQQFASAARNAVEHAGFDGVELHFANGYLVDQFIQTNSNTRNDEYGGSLENRLRFPLEVLEAVTHAVGQKRVGFRVGPWSRFQGMRMQEPDIIETFSTLFKKIRSAFPELAYAHLVEPRIAGSSDDPDADQGRDSNDFLRAIWAPRPLVIAGGFDRESAEHRADSTGDLIAFGRKFISNPDLPTRLRLKLPLEPYSRATFYTKGAVGYTDYPFAKETPQSSL